MKPHTGIRTFELVQWLTGYVEWTRMEDLPPQLYDAIMIALEKTSHEVQLPLAIVGVRCDKDFDSTDPRRQFFLHVIASEIVIADERDTRRSGMSG